MSDCLVNVLEIVHFIKGIISTAEQCSQKRCLQRFPHPIQATIAFEHLNLIFQILDRAVVFQILVKGFYKSPKLKMFGPEFCLHWDSPKTLSGGATQDLNLGPKRPRFVDKGLTTAYTSTGAASQGPLSMSGGLWRCELRSHVAPRFEVPGDNILSLVHFVLRQLLYDLCLKIVPLLKTDIP